MNKRERKLFDTINHTRSKSCFGIDEDGQIVQFAGNIFKISVCGWFWYRGKTNASNATINDRHVYTKKFKGVGWRKKIYRVEDSKLVTYKRDAEGIFKPVA